jgi:hypothetical protein
MHRLRLIVCTGLTVLALFHSPPAAAQSVAPVTVTGNPDCSDLGFWDRLSYRLDGGFDGTHVLRNGTNTVGTLTVQNPPDGNPDSGYFTWESTLLMKAVIVRGGGRSNVYRYIPQTKQDLALPGLQPPPIARGQISQIEFCGGHVFPLTITKTAETTFDRAYTWEIDKSADETEITVIDGQSYIVNYFVTVSLADSTDSNWAVAGEISIYNPWPSTATVTDVTDEMTGGIAAAVVCPDPFPFTVDSGETVTCTYATALPDGTDRTNTATVTATGNFIGGTATAPVTFGAPANLTDECVEVSDDGYGVLGTVCVGGEPYTFEVPIDVGQMASTHECPDDITHTNVATATANDTGTQVSDDHTLIIHLVCEPDGCSLTQGYWKTHSEYGPAPYDDTWNLLPGGDGVPGSGDDGADTPFFTTGLTWHEIWGEPPSGGNDYIKLAHQWMAAKLNGLNGADISVINGGAGDVTWGSCTAGTLSCAEDLLAQYAAQWDDPDSIPDADNDEMNAMASRLDDYNNGDIGPGHCDEDRLSNPQPRGGFAPRTGSEVGTASAVTTGSLPEAFALEALYPNPFSATSNVRLALPESGDVAVVVYDVLGREVVRLVDGPLEAGRHTVAWDARGVPSGTYVVVLRAGSFQQARSVVLVR